MSDLDIPNTTQVPMHTKVRHVALVSESVSSGDATSWTGSRNQRRGKGRVQHQSQPPSGPVGNGTNQPSGK